MNQNNMNEEVEIDLLALLHALMLKWWMIAICTVLGAVLALGITMSLIAPQYESQAMLYILSKTTSVTSLADIQLGSALTKDFEMVAKSKPVIDGAIAQIQSEDGKTFTREQITNMLTVTNASDTRILVIQATSASPTDACIVANAIAENTASQMASIMKSDPPTTLESAEVAEKPSSPSKAKNTVIGALLGFILMCGILVVRFLMNDNIQSEEDIEKYLGLNTLVVIPIFKKTQNNKEQELKDMEAGLMRDEKK